MNIENKKQRIEGKDVLFRRSKSIKILKVKKWKVDTQKRIEKVKADDKRASREKWMYFLRDLSKFTQLYLHFDIRFK